MAKNSLLNPSMWALSFVFLALIATPILGISCPDAIAKLNPCKPFLMGSGAITVSCCEGLQSLQASYKSYNKPTCQCLQQLVSSGFTKPVLEKARLLPQLCKVENPLVLIEPTTNCDSHRMATHEVSDSNRYKEMRSPGMGHGSPPPPLRPANMEVSYSNRYREMRSPGMGHGSPPPPLRPANMEVSDSNRYREMRSPGMGHGSPPPPLWPANMATHEVFDSNRYKEMRSPGMGHGSPPPPLRPANMATHEVSDSNRYKEMRSPGMGHGSPPPPLRPAREEKIN